jgi:uncharacterized paraquat-inducible protein A
MESNNLPVSTFTEVKEEELLSRVESIAKTDIPTPCKNDCHSVSLEEKAVAFQKKRCGRCKTKQ